MTNELLLLAEIPLLFSALVLIHKYFGRYGLYAWIALMAVLSNIYVAKQVELFGISCTLGCVTYCSVFLATDILSELYGSQHSLRAVRISVVCVLLYALSSQYLLLFVPGNQDQVDASMHTVFSLSMRVSIASIAMYYLSNLLDIFLFDKLKCLYPDALWLRNNVSTMVSNILENFIFVFLAFYGVYSFEACLEIALSTSILEFLIALCDTPFLYWAKSHGARLMD